MGGPYTLSGSGVQAIDACGALHIHIDTPAAGAGAGRAYPATYFGVGFIKLGTSYAYFNDTPISSDDQVVPCPNGTTRFGYALLGGAVVTVTEVAGASPWQGPPGDPGATGAAGATGATGATGAAGATGPGVAAGGTVGQVLTKLSSTNYDTNWQTPSGGSSTLTTATAHLSADVACTNSNTWYDGPSVSLAAGTWLVMGAIDIKAGGGTHCYARLWDGTTTSASGQAFTPDVRGVSIPVGAVITLGSTSTIKISAALDWTGGVIIAALTENGVGNNASWILAVKVG